MVAGSPRRRSSSRRLSLSQPLVTNGCRRRTGELSTTEEDDTVRTDPAGRGEQHVEGIGESTQEPAVLRKGLRGDEDEAGVLASGCLVLGVEGMKSSMLAVTRARPLAAASGRIC